ncbi:hypothetical protein [Comamonas thiooxydans]|uniref:hypothetical protein n=1 Tax=Comamonas thiooxydans TaxID=363952 RepID=UPI000B4185CF|nr:hypothetical protein [Comamonas thiooxydans]
MSTTSLTSLNSLATLQAVGKLNEALHIAGKSSDQAFLAALKEKQDFCASRGLTPELLVESIADEVMVSVEISKDGEKPEVFTYPAIHILAYHQDSRSWAEVGNDPAAQHEQAAYAEVFAFWHEKGRFGEAIDGYEINLKY